MVKMSVEAKKMMGNYRRPVRFPVAISMSQRDQVNLRNSGGTPPPKGPNPGKKAFQLALGTSSLLAAGLVCLLSGTLTGLLLLPPAFYFLANAFKKDS